jgi:hypothetical protein
LGVGSFLLGLGVTNGLEAHRLAFDGATGVLGTGGGKRAFTRGALFAGQRSPMRLRMWR